MPREFPNNRILSTALICWMAMTGAALALDEGKVSSTDPRVRIYAYQPEEVYALKGYFGFASTVFFRSDEKIKAVTAGDSEAWDVSVSGSKDYIFIKPTKTPPRRTNMTVITDRRTYVFDLMAGELDREGTVTPPDLTLKVRFDYSEPLIARPDPEAIEAAHLAAERAAELERERIASEAALERERMALRAEELRLAEDRAREDRLLEIEEARLAQEEARARAAEERRLAQEAAASAELRRLETLQRLRAPSVIFDETSGGNAPSAQNGGDLDFTNERAYGERLLDAREDDQLFLDDAAARRFEGASAYQLGSLETKVLQGTLISGNLETAVNSSLSGLLRASISEDVWAADGSEVLIPRGSRLIGNYRSAVRFGTSRVLIAWSRIIRPDGLSVEIGSPGTDQLGRAGLTGHVDTHFLTRFGAAALISIIDSASVLALAQLDNGVSRDSGEDLSAANNDNFARLLEPYINIPTTVHVDQGARVVVFVARDLDFGTPI